MAIAFSRLSRRVIAWTGHLQKAIKTFVTTTSFMTWSADYMKRCVQYLSLCNFFASNHMTCNCKSASANGYDSEMAITICNIFRRIFGILLMMSRPRSIIEFVKLGIDDTNLPLTEKRGGKPYINWRLVGRAKLFASTRGKPSNTKTSVIGNTPFLHHSLRGRKGRFAILDWTPNESNSPSTRCRENIMENIVDPLCQR